MERIGFGTRFLAGLIDAVIMIVTAAILGMFLGVGSAALSISVSPTGFSIGMIIFALIPLAYSYTEVLMSASPGKKALGLLIKNEDGSVTSPNILQKRWAVKYSSSLLRLAAAITTISFLSTLGSILGLIVFLGCFLVFMDPKQALHDKIAKTAVF